MARVAEAREATAVAPREAGATYEGWAIRICGAAIRALCSTNQVMLPQKFPEPGTRHT